MLPSFHPLGSRLWTLADLARGNAEFHIDPACWRRMAAFKLAKFSLFNGNDGSVSSNDARVQHKAAIYLRQDEEERDVRGEFRCTRSQPSW